MDAPSSITYCANHPKVETSLRCKTCGKPICASCAIRTPTGYSCKECVRSQQRTFITAGWVDYLFGVGTAALLSLLASFLVVLDQRRGRFLWLVPDHPWGANGRYDHRRGDSLCDPQASLPPALPGRECGSRCGCTPGCCDEPAFIEYFRSHFPGDIPLHCYPGNLHPSFRDPIDQMIC